MPTWIARVLDWPMFAPIARIVLTFPFWFSGISKLVMFSDAVEEVAQYGLRPAMPVACLVIFVQLGASLLIVINRRAWSGAGALAIFTLMTIPVAHDFWNLRGHLAQAELNIAAQHFGLIGGLMLAAILSRSSPHRGA